MKDKMMKRHAAPQRQMRRNSEKMAECYDEDEDMDDEEGSGMVAYEEPVPIIAVRSNFNPLANFTPAVQVNEDGLAQIDVKIPDNLTRYRYRFLFTHSRRTLYMCIHV
jgi:hypothetical protein